MKLRTATLLMLSIGASCTAGAQEIEPGVQTSTAAAPAPASTPPAAASSAAGKPAPAAKPKPASPPPAPKVTDNTGDKAAGKPGAKSSDRIQLDTTEISGNQELPKVMYVVPWRRADPGEFNGRPPNSLLDEALTPVDRDVFKRQNRYYGALQNSGKDEK